MKGYSTLSRALELEPHHKIQFNIIPRTCLFFVKWEECILSSANRDKIKEKYFDINKKYKKKKGVMLFFSFKNRNTLHRKKKDV